MRARSRRQEIIDHEFDLVRRSVLSRQHDLTAVARDIARVRSRLAGSAHEVWDIRGLPGGLDDVEFAAEYLQLAGAAPDDSEVAGLSATFERAGQRGVLTPALVRDLIGAAHAVAEPRGLLPHDVRRRLRRACGEHGAEEDAG